MRHGVMGRTFARTAAHRKSMRRNLVQSLIEHGRIRTTLEKAKDIRRFAERLITLAINGSVSARQRALALLNDRSIIPAAGRAEYETMTDTQRDRVLRSGSGRRHRHSITKPGVSFTAESIIHRLFGDIGPKMKRRNERKNAAGGYTRLIKIADRRLNDGGQLAILEFVGEDDAARSKGSDRTNRKRRAKVKYSFYAGKAIERRGGRRTAKPAVAKDAATGS